MYLVGKTQSYSALIIISTARKMQTFVVDAWKL